MKQTGRYFIALGCVLCAAILVLDGDVVAAGALSGVQLCLQTVIPSLFCFMVLTGFLIKQRPLPPDLPAVGAADKGAVLPAALDGQRGAAELDRRLSDGSQINCRPAGTGPP